LNESIADEIPDRHLNAQLSAHRFHVPSERVELEALDIAMLDLRHAVLAHLQLPRELDLGQVQALTELTESVGPDSFEHLLLEGVDLLPVNRTLRHHVVKTLGHRLPPPSPSSYNLRVGEWERFGIPAVDQQHFAHPNRPAWRGSSAGPGTFHAGNCDKRCLLENV